MKNHWALGKVRVPSTEIGSKNENSNYSNSAYIKIFSTPYYS